MIILHTKLPDLSIKGGRNIMSKTNAIDIRNIMGKLVAKWYSKEGVIEIVIKGCRLQLIIPPETPIRVNRGEVSAK